MGSIAAAISHHIKLPANQINYEIISYTLRGA